MFRGRYCEGANSDVVRVSWCLCQQLDGASGMISKVSSIAGPFFLLLALSSWEMLAVYLTPDRFCHNLFFFSLGIFFFLDTQGLDDVLSPVCNGKHGAML